MIDTALPIVTGLKSPESSATISPPGSVFESAPVKVRHGAVSEHALTSLPVEATKVRGAAWTVPATIPASTTATLVPNTLVGMSLLPPLCPDARRDADAGYFSGTRGNVRATNPRCQAHSARTASRA